MHLSSYMPGGIRVEGGSLEAERRTWLVLNLPSDMHCQGDHKMRSLQASLWGTLSSPWGVRILTSKYGTEFNQTLYTKP